MATGGGKGKRKTKRRRPPARIHTRLNADESPFGVAAAVTAAWEAQRTADPRKYGLNRYPDFLRLDMVQALAARHGLESANYAPLGGNAEIGNVLAAALLRAPGSELLQSWPIRDPISRAARGWNATVRRVGLDSRHRQDLDALADRAGEHTRLVHLQNPHDPGGQVFTQSALEAFLSRVGERAPQAYVWIDETHARYVNRADFPDCFALIGRDPEGSKLIVSRSLAGAAGLAGVPAAFLAGSRAIAQQAIGVSGGYVVPDYGWTNEASVSRMGEKALLAMLTDDGERHYTRVRDLNRLARTRLAQLLREHKLRVVEGEAGFVLAQRPGRANLAAALRRRGVAVYGAPANWGSRYRGWMRVSVGTANEHDRLDRALAAELRAKRKRKRKGKGRRTGGATAGVTVAARAQRVPVRTRRGAVAGAAAFAAAGIALPRGLGRVADAASTRRGFLRGAAATAALAYGVSRSPAAGAFPPDSFYDRFNLARMLYHENPVGPPPVALEAIRELIARGPTAARRLEDDDPPDLVAAILRRNAKVSPSARRLSARNVLVTLGSAEGLFLSADTFVAGRTLAVEWPSYRIVRERVLQQGGTVLDVPVTADFRPDYAALKQALRDHPETRLVRLEAQNNPCGTTLQRGPFDDFARHVFSAHPQTVILIDESDPEYMEPASAARRPDFLRYVAEKRNLVHIQTFSHVYGLTGLRVGYILANEKLIDQLKAKRISRPTSVFARAGALAALGDAEGQIRRCAPVIDEGRRYLYGELDKMGLRYLRSNGQYLFLDTGRSGTGVWASLIGLGVLTRYGREWGMEGWIRVCPGRPEENQRFIASLRTVLSQPDPGNPPQAPIPLEPLLPPNAEGRALAAGLERRQRYDLAMERLAGPLRQPYRVVRA
jgi:histidinol-phosphate aminotransferase